MALHATHARGAALGEVALLSKLLCGLSLHCQVNMCKAPAVKCEVAGDVALVGRQAVARWLSSTRMVD